VKIQVHLSARDFSTWNDGQVGAYLFCKTDASKYVGWNVADVYLGLFPGRVSQLA
jgi:hypothetical protein